MYKKALEEIASLVKPDTILAWYRTFDTQKFDDSRKQKT